MPDAILGGQPETTPPQGIRDGYVNAGTTVAGVKVYSEYHWFKSDFGKGLSAKVEYADFREDDVLAGAARKPDTRKVWLTLLYSLE